LKNFYKRSLTGIAFVAVLGGGIVFHPATLFLLFAVIIGLGLWEFYRLIHATELKPNKIAGLVAGLAFFAVTCLYASGVITTTGFWFVVPFVYAIVIAELYRKQLMPFQNIALSLLGVLYVAIPLSLLVLLGFPQLTIPAYQPTMILGYFFLLWSSDTGAYLTGISIGRHPMFARVSPKKSWEGFAGGMVLTLLVAYFISKYFTTISTIDWLVIALIICIFGVLGDLIESLLKRSLQIKDSGNILPGHGGILDRFDSVLFSVPMVFLYLQLKNYLMLL
jgi:phosphatidate cytidylyltransferase